MTEFWIPCKEDPRYDVSDLGRVRSWRKGRDGLRGSPKLLTPGVASHGYPTVDFSGKTYTVHRLVASNHLGATGEYQVHHINGDRGDARADNLMVVASRKEHMEHHEFPIGEDHHNAKLTWKDVFEIRNPTDSSTQEEVALRYGISRANVSAIRLGKSWPEELT